MKTLTIKDLYNECEKQMLKGNADKIVMVTDDDEANGYHTLWYGVSDEIDDIKALSGYGMLRGYDAEKVVLIG